MVYVINKDGTPLMPCMPVVARLLLKQGKAKCIKRSPFTIKLLYQATSSIQNITLGIDPGSNKIGSAAVKDNGDVVYLSQIQIRNNITKKMVRRVPTVADGFYQLSQGLRSERKIPKCKIQGFKALDKVKYLGNIYFIKSRHSTGYAGLMDINGNKIDLKPIPKFNKLERLNTRKSWLVDVLKF